MSVHLYRNFSCMYLVVGWLGQLQDQRVRDIERRVSSEDEYRTFAPLVSAHPYCAWKFTCHVMYRALKWTMIGQMTIAIALLGFNALGRSVTPTFLFRNRFYLQLFPTCPKKWTKNQCGKLKKFQVFCPRDMESCHLTAARRVKLWSLNANLFFEEPHQLTKFA